MSLLWAEGGIKCDDRLGRQNAKLSVHSGN